MWKRITPKSTGPSGSRNEKKENEKTLIIASTHIHHPLSDRERLNEISIGLHEFLAGCQITLMTAYTLYQLWQKSKTGEIDVLRVFKSLYSHRGVSFFWRKQPISFGFIRSVIPASILNPRDRPNPSLHPVCDASIESFLCSRHAASSRTGVKNLKRVIEIPLDSPFSLIVLYIRLNFRGGFRAIAIGGRLRCEQQKGAEQTQARDRSPWEFT